MTIRTNFVARFGGDQALAIEVAAESHKNGLKDEAHLEEHDGDVCYLALACGMYNEFLPQETIQ